MSALTVLFPRIRAELLRLLFLSPEKELHVREIARLTQFALGTIQTETTKLESAGLLISRRDGNRLYFRANTAHPLFPELRSLTQKTVGLAAQLATAIADMDGVRFALIFGSEAAGTATAASDVDLLVLGDVGLRALAPRLRPLSETLGREINPHAMSVETFIQKKHAGDAFITSVCAGPKLFLKGESHEFEKLG